MKILNSKGNIFWQALIFSSPVLAYALITFFSDVWYWIKAVYFPGPSRHKTTLDEALRDFYWQGYLKSFLFAATLFFLVCLILTLAKRKKRVSILVSYLYLFPSVFLTFWFLRSFLNISGSDSMLGLYSPFFLIVLIIVIVANWKFLKLLQKLVKENLT